MDPAAATTEQHDAAQLAAVAAGDRAAMAPLVRRLTPLAWSIASRLVADEGAAREVVQDAFVAIWRGAADWTPERGSVATWTVGVVRARAIDRLRRDGAQRRGGAATMLPLEAAAGAAATGATVDDGVEQVERAGAVREALAELPAQQRVLVELAFLHGYTHAEIAEHLGLAVGTVKTRVFRGLARLRDLLDPDLFQEDRR